MDEGVEVRKPRVARIPRLPTKAEVEAHFPLHLPYADWCPHCNEGKGMSNQHRTVKDKEEIGITISMDYAFMTDKEREDEVPPILVLYDHDKRRYMRSQERKASMIR